VQIDPHDIERARRAIDGIAHRTPVANSAALSDLTGAAIWLKAENLQRTGSFKIRGALSKLDQLGTSAANGVTAGSAGNHAQSLAFAAKSRDIPCEIFVPVGAPIAKVEAARYYQATVTEVGESLTEAVAAAQVRAVQAKMAFCHPYDDPAVVAGQATLGIELTEEFGSALRHVIVPLGGGGLASGVAIAVKRFDPTIRVTGVQASACAPYVTGETPHGAVLTLADGIAVKQPGTITRPLVERWVDDLVVVDEESIADAMVLLMERSKLVVEGAGAVGVAALLSRKVAPAASGLTCVILSGGNLDLNVVSGLIRRNETQAGRRLILFALISDRPGGLARLLTIFAESGANLIEVEHVREGVSLHVRETGVQAVLEVRNREHAGRVVAAAETAGYEITVRG
jgi:threonine dehydratase